MKRGATLLDSARSSEHFRVFETADRTCRKKHMLNIRGLG
jgi:hypothetical protein